MLLDTVNITVGLKDGGWIVINTNRDLQVERDAQKFRVATVDANKIALKYGLGSRSAPIVNTAIVGAFAGATKLVGLEAVLEAVEEFVPPAQGEQPKGRGRGISRRRVSLRSDAYQSIESGRASFRTT